MRLEELKETGFIDIAAAFFSCRTTMQEGARDSE